MISRRDLLKAAGLVGVGYSAGALPPAVGGADYKLEIAPVTLELSRRERLTTNAYNGQVPGPLLRFKEGVPVVIDVTNRTRRPEVVHWHGLFTPPAADGAIEEGTAPIVPGATARYSFTPRPAGFRWYHTHTMAMNDLSLAQYGGQHGSLLVEPRQNPARYDQEFFLVLHDWKGYLLANDDGAMNPSYAVTTINGKELGTGEPLRVKQGEQVLLHVLNSSPTEVHWLALAGHALRVMALDGNPVPTPRPVPMMRLAPGERVCALVEMNNPGVWVLGEVRRHVQLLGMGIIVEYANRTGAARWQQPTQLAWQYEHFANDSPDTSSDAPSLIPLVFESKFRGHGAMEGWTINGASYPDGHVAPLRPGQRYRLQFINKSMDDHPVHLHRHSFELYRVGVPLNATADDRSRNSTGIMKDVVLVNSQTCTEVDFTADNPGPSLFHCHQQNHMDLGFMMLFNYA